MSTKYDYFDGTAAADYSAAINATTDWAAQTFTGSATYSITSAKWYLGKTSGADIGTVTCSVKATDGNGHPTGNDLASGEVNSDNIPAVGSQDWVEFTFTSPTDIISGTKYALVIRVSNAAASRVLYPSYEQVDGCANGNYEFSVNSGGDWTAQSGYDFFFQTYSSLIPSDKLYSRELIAIAGNEFWYGISAGTMEEVSDANGDIDCNKKLSAVEAYQKIFIANETNLKVFDRINTKITTDDIKPTDKVIPLKGTLLAGGTSTAKMIVDYIDASDGSCNIYGYRITAATFIDTEEVTGTVTTEDDVTFTLNANEDAPPHWYDWTVYSGDATTYGTMPTSSSLLALYRGRMVYNDNLRPYAWYMTTVENPWKIKYDYDTDGDLSAVTYTNTEVGEVGDIITAIISYKDDLLIWGCANSIWILVGDPLGSGENAQITNKTGIWGSHSWCIDDKSNLYFLGDDGIYRMPVSQSYSPPENITKLVLPNLIADLDLDKSLHRVVFGFDPIKQGIHICKTLLSDGTNTNYWYDLITGGFYPEAYPASCGVFSSCYYPATDDTYKKYLVGCTDGYIREFDNSTKDDATTSSTEAIDSYFAVVKSLSDNEDTEGKLTWLNGITAGGGAGGDFSDTDSVSYSLYSGDDAETTLEKMKAETDWATATVYAVGDLVVYNSVEYICITAHTSNADGPPNEEPDTNITDWLATEFATGTWTGAGKQTKNRVRMRGGWYGLKLKNDTASETWAINSIYINKEKAGKLR